MKLFSSVAAAASLLTLVCGPAAGDPGGSAYQFLQLGVGARPSAMGEAFAGVGGDVAAMYWNPAGIAGLEQRELSLTRAAWLEDISYSNLAFALPGLGGTVGAGFSVLNSGDIPKADNTGRRLGNYDMSEALGLVSYAKGDGDFALGGSLKFISSRIEEEGALSFAADLGARYGGLRPWNRKLGLGLSVQNLGAGARYVSEYAPLPLLIRAGAELEVAKEFLLVSDVNYLDESFALHAGGEYVRRYGAFTVALRAGYKDDVSGDLGALSGVTAGLGLKWMAYRLDYAWNSFAELGATHRVSLGISFDPVELP